ncbi:MAG: UBP-type zinc finger domain-containing protein [Actinomycetia bacterium]|nr:UBP-type zinc finger domain-containing protein [Actinomycetes bacterium]
MACEHLGSAPTPDPPEVFECAECAATGGTWISLRQCLECGHVGCCDSSPHRHANAHFEETGHPTAGSVEPGEFWRVCFIHRVIG